MARNIKPNEELIAQSPVQLSLAVELQALKDAGDVIVANLNDRLLGPGLAARRLEQIIEKAYDLGGQAEWNRLNGQIQAPWRESTETPWLPACDCPKAGIWGATGRMPEGHIWQWRNLERSSGYLAHT